MDQKMTNCERMGVSPKWPKRNKLVDRIQKRQLDLSADLERIGEYASRLDVGAAKLISNSINVTKYDAARDVSRYKIDEILALAFTHATWLTDLTHWTRYYQVAMGQEFFWHDRYRIVFPDRTDGGLRMFNMESAAHMLAVMALLGWRDAVVYQGYLTHAALNRGYQLELQYTEEHRRAQAFMLRLFANWAGDVSHAWPAYAYDEPIYETLLQHWRTPDADDLVPCLLAACDRHTHQTSKDTLKNFYDFHNVGLARTPVEILLLFRLRDWEGLPNPTLDHPLMAAPFDKLPSAQPVPPLDALMQAVLKRAREDWPQYDAVLALETLKRG